MFTFRQEQFAQLRKERLAAGLVRQLRAAKQVAERDPETGDVVAADALGQRSRYSFDRDGFIGAMATPLGRRYTFDSRPDGSPASVTNPAGRQLGFEYYGDGTLAGVSQDGQLISQLHYAPNRLLTGIGWYDGTSTRFGYSSARKVTSITNRLGHSEQYEFDQTALLTGIADGNGNRTTFHYANWNRPSRTQFADGSQEYYDFNSAGHLEDIRSGSQHVVKLAYGDGGRPVNFSYGDGRNRDIAYDGEGRITEAVNADVAATFAYDDTGRVVSDDQGGQLIRYEYDAVGNLVSMDYPGGDKIRYAYDADRRLTSVTDWNGQVHSFSYKPGDAGHIAHIPGDVSIDLTLARSGLPIGSVAVQAGQGRPLFSQQWRYDIENNLVESVDGEFGGRSYRYDAEGQVLASTQQGPVPAESFGYDAAGNRVSYNGAVVTYNVTNQLTAQGSLVPQYDQRGNMTLFPGSNGAWQLTYDLQNQVIAADGPRGERLSFAYDALNRRILKRFERPGAVACETRYVWAGEQMVQSVEVVGDRKRTQEFLYLPGSYTPLATRIDGLVYSYHCDPLGRPTRLTDGGGRVVWSAVYGAFGELYPVVAEVPNSLRAPGQYHDEETGLYYNRFRYYSTHLGRYLSRDPIGMLEGPNLYAYVRNNPVNRTDPLGLSWDTIASSVAAGIGAAALVAAIALSAPISVPALAIAAGAAAMGVGVGLGVNKALNLKEFCLPCFLEAFASGFCMGVGITALAIAATLAFPAAATAIAVTGAIVGIGLMLNEHLGWKDLKWLGGAKSFDEMTPEEQNRSLGGLTGGLVGSVAIGERAAALKEGGYFENAPMPKGGRAVGESSGRQFDPDNAGGPIKNLNAQDATITHEGVDGVEQHLSRFGQDDANDFMVDRLRSIADGQMEPTEYDNNFYTHELGEAERYDNLGWPEGQPSNPDEAYDLWNNAHSATLEDYGVSDGELYHPDAPKEE